MIVIKKIENHENVIIVHNYTSNTTVPKNTEKKKKFWEGFAGK